MFAFVAFDQAQEFISQAIVGCLVREQPPGEIGKRSVERQLPLFLPL